MNENRRIFGVLVLATCLFGLSIVLFRYDRKAEAASGEATRYEALLSHCSAEQTGLKESLDLANQILKDQLVAISFKVTGVISEDGLHGTEGEWFFYATIVTDQGDLSLRIPNYVLTEYQKPIRIMEDQSGYDRILGYENDTFGAGSAVQVLLVSERGKFPKADYIVLEMLPAP